MSESDAESVDTIESSPDSKSNPISEWFSENIEKLMIALFVVVFITIVVLLVIFFPSSRGISGPSNHPKSTVSSKIYSYFGTKTSYGVVGGNIVKPSKSTCQPVQIWMIVRHGTTYPTAPEIRGMLKMNETREQILKNHKKKGGALKSSVLRDLKNWNFDKDMKIHKAEQLTSQGDQEMRTLGERIRKAFPVFFNVTAKNLKNKDFIFRAANTPQTNASMRAFSRGLFNTANMAVAPVRPPPGNDTLLMAYKSCHTWEQRYYKEHLDAEINNFKKSGEIKKILRQLNQRLGFNQTSMNYDMMMSMYNLCRYETAWHPKRRSVWCDLFDSSELEILEYQEDLEHYYYDGPGRPGSAKLGCHPLKDMLTRFANIVNRTSTNSTKGVFYFTDAVTLQTLMAALGTDGGSSRPLTANGYRLSGHRKFRTSLLNPFGTNVMAVLYRCNGSRYSVSFHVAENLQTNGCPKGLCSWSHIEQKYRPIMVRSCSMDFCH